MLQTKPRVGGTRVRRLLRLVLAILGVGQIVLAVVSFLGARNGPFQDQLAGATVTHLANEYSAWNLALGVGFLWVAWRIGRAAGLVPTLAVFVVVLTAFEVVDVIAGHVDVLRVVSHGMVQAGLLVMLVLARPYRGSGGFFPLSRTAGTRLAPERRDEDAETEADGDGSGTTGLRPTARRVA